MPLSDIAGVQPDGYLVRFPFYVVAERDAHIVFSPTDNPDWFADDVYEFGKYARFFFVLFCFVLVHFFCFSLNWEAIDFDHHPVYMHVFYVSSIINYSTILYVYVYGYG